MIRAPVAILAGGLASRLYPLTQNTPKALLPLAGRPFLFHQLDQLRREGIDRVVLCVGHLGEQIVTAVDDGAQFGLSVTYSFDGDRRVGTGGALKRALPLLGPEFFVLYGDSYVPALFEHVLAAYVASGRPALMTIFNNCNRWDRSNVWFDGHKAQYEKDTRRSGPTHIDCGLSVMSRDVFAAYPAVAEIDLADIWRNLSLDGQLAMFEVKERFYEIGSRNGMTDAESYLRAL
jgi:N-acetyl-alpha-D-muramate 1-phosphate uridylyltransferase